MAWCNLEKKDSLFNAIKFYEPKSLKYTLLYQQLLFMDTFKLTRITREHILQAIRDIDRLAPALRASTVYDVIYKGKRYPPRELIRLAHRAATGTAGEWAASAGAATNAYLQKLGFAIVNKRPLFLTLPEDEALTTELAAPAEIAVALSSPHIPLAQAAESKAVYQAKPVKSYRLADALAELFLEENQIKSLLAALQRKKNLILQGPPGTGKSFLAKRLAFLEQGSRHPDRIEVVQFHAGYAYDDFIQGYRPDAAGIFKLSNGIFYTFCQRAAAEPEQLHFFLIEEINRGNVGSIFGEMLFLLEADKRGPAFATTLTYGPAATERFYIPENVYVIGTMNTADRSLTLLDYALRRRFAFFKMEPQFGLRFQAYLAAINIPPDLIKQLVQKLTKLNQVIAEDPNLGTGFQVGHAYFSNPPVGAGADWISAVIENELTPLLEEYWFDQPKLAAAQLKQLRKN